MRFAVSFAALALVAASAAPAVSAASRPTCLVSNQRTGVGAGSLQAAVNAAAPGDTLTVKGTCFGGTTIGKSLTIKGLSSRASGPATLDGRGTKRVLLADYSSAAAGGSALSLIGLTVTHGLANDGNGGGGMLIRGGRITVQDSIVAANSSVLAGGGIEAGGGSLSLVRTTVRDNTAGDRGGGISSAGTVNLADSVVSGNTARGVGGGLALGSGAITVSGSTVSKNRGAGGGGVYNAGTLTMTGSTVSSNTSSAEGGGLLDGHDGIATITTSSFVTNHATSAGGGIANRGTLKVTGSNIGGNVSANAGGGLWNYQGTAAIVSSKVGSNSAMSGGGIASTTGRVSLAAVTVSSNKATVNGGAVLVAASMLDDPSEMTIDGSTITGNTAADGGGVVDWGTLTFIGAPTTVGSNTATGDGGGVLFNPVSVVPGSVTGGCPTSLGGNVVYTPSNTPTDYVGFACTTPVPEVMPVPQLATRGIEDFTGSDGKPYTRYELTVTNWADFGAYLFKPAPDLAPCGTNTNASRAWVDIFNNVTKSRIYEFCALTTPKDLTTIWFALPRGTLMVTPRGSVAPIVYITITDRRTGKVVTSNPVSFAP